jgi:hypothetical protein
MYHSGGRLQEGSARLEHGAGWGDMHNANSERKPAQKKCKAET